jgi:aminoglycoside/choline kinase family phosphotransferase
MGNKFTGNQLINIRDAMPLLQGIPYYRGNLGLNLHFQQFARFCDTTCYQITMSSTHRDQQLNTWLANLATPALRPDTLRPASNDASFRRYFRIDSISGESLVVMDAPPPEDCARFVKVGTLLAECGITVPQILAQDLEHGFLLLSDLGQSTYLHQLGPDSAHHLYMDAIGALLRIQCHSRPGVLPEYDQAFILRELNLFPEWYLGKHLGLQLSEKQQAELDRMFALLAERALAQARVFMHRDYHSRNLMVLPSGNPGILDFQDAVHGPISYDLVSLLRDAYISWDEEMVLDWAVRYWEQAKRLGLPVNPDIDGFYQDFEWMGLQRHLKILGIFARLAHRDGKPHYLDDIPLVLEYVRKTANRYVVFKPLLRLLDLLEGGSGQFGDAMPSLMPNKRVH